MSGILVTQIILTPNNRTPFILNETLEFSLGESIFPSDALCGIWICIIKYWRKLVLHNIFLLLMKLTQYYNITRTFRGEYKNLLPWAWKFVFTEAFRLRWILVFMGGGVNSCIHLWRSWWHFYPILADLYYPFSHWLIMITWFVFTLWNPQNKLYWGLWVKSPQYKYISLSTGPITLHL